MRPKLILTDLDGTLLREDKTLSPITRAALEQAAAQGEHQAKVSAHQPKVFEVENHPANQHKKQGINMREKCRNFLQNF